MIPQGNMGLCDQPGKILNPAGLEKGIIKQAG
jgi:hypothetical protein